MTLNSPESHIPKVSIGMPVYNGEKFIREALDSVLAQTFQDFEVVLSDNASTDGTRLICEEYARKDDRIRCISHGHNIGAKQNASFTLREAVGRYFTWLAHDDYLMPTFLEVCVALLEECPSLIGASGDFRMIDACGNLICMKELLDVRAEIPWKVRMREFFRYSASDSFFVIYGCFRRDTLLDVYDRTPQGPLVAASELPLLARLAARGEIASIGKVLRAYRYHAESMYCKETQQMADRGFAGRFLRAYNVWWKRLDQYRVLLTSSIPLHLKCHVFCHVTLSYVSGLMRAAKRAKGRCLRSRAT